MLVLAGQASTASPGAMVVKNLATGIDDATGQKIPANVHDTDWKWDGPSSTVYLFAQDQAGIPPNFLTDDASGSSRWLYFHEAPGAPFLFELRFDLSPFDAATARIQGLRIAADNWVKTVSLNGQPLFEQPPPPGFGLDYEHFVEIGTLGQGDFVAGGNVLSIEIVNDPRPDLPGGLNPTALRVEGLVVAELVAAPHASFQGLGDLPGGETESTAHALSADGSTVVGSSRSMFAPTGEAFRWRNGAGIEPLGCIAGYCESAPGSDSEISRGLGVSADGGVVAGESIATVEDFFCAYIPSVAVFTWTSSAGFGTHAAGTRYAFRAFSSDASTVGGDFGYTTSVSSCAWLGWGDGWIDSGDGVTPVPVDAGGLHANIPRAISANGAIVAGADRYTRDVFLWSGAPSVAVLAERFEPLGMSQDGRWLVGSSLDMTTPVVWSESGGLRTLEVPPGTTAASARYISPDGRTILGSVNAEPWIWLGSDPPQRLDAWLELEHGIVLGGWSLTGVAGISNDGRFIAGNGTNPSGQSEAWIADIPLPIPEPAPVALGIAALAALRGLRRGARPPERETSGFRSAERRMLAGEMRAARGA